MEFVRSCRKTQDSYAQPLGRVGGKVRWQWLAAALLSALILVGCDETPHPNVLLWIDNGNSTAIRIEMDGKTLSTVAAGARTDVMILPGSHKFRAIARDGSILSDVGKLLCHDARCVYNPGGKNAYAIETRTYDVSASQYVAVPDVKDLGNSEWIDAGRVDYVFRPFPDTVDIHYDPTDTHSGPVFQAKRTRLDRQPPKS